MSNFDNRSTRDPDLTVDGFTEEEIERMIFDSVVEAKCTDCGDITLVEPDARAYDCHSCGSTKSITSPLIKLGLV